MLNTTDDVAVTNIAMKQTTSMILSSIQCKRSSPFLCLVYVLSMFLNLGHFSSSSSYKRNFSYKNSVFLVPP